MNIPFQFALSSTNPYGILWNPWGATIGNSVVNTVLDNLSADLLLRYGLTPPRGPVYVTCLTAIGDAADGKVSLGIYDTDRAAFDELFPINAMVVAGGGVVDQTLGYGDGLYLPCSATLIPVIKYTPNAGTLGLTGNLALIVLQNQFGNPVLAPPSSSLQSEADGSDLLDEANGLPLQSE